MPRQRKMSRTQALCESMWARFKEEKFYGKLKSEKMSMVEVKQMVFRYFWGYWNNRRICSAIHAEFRHATSGINISAVFLSLLNPKIFGFCVNCY